MTDAKREIGARLPFRRGLGEAEAAVYVGLSPNKFRDMVGAGAMPKPRVAGRRRIWDIDDLDAAFKALPIEGEQDRADTWADVA